MNDSVFLLDASNGTWNGLTPSMRISQTQTPNIQTSEAAVNLLKLIDSGDIHLMGSLPRDAL